MNTTCLKRIAGLVRLSLFACTVACFLPLAASAQSLRGRWQSSDGAVYDVADVNGRVFFRQQGITRFWGYVSGNTVLLRQGLGQAPSQATITTDAYGNVQEIRLASGSVLRRADASTDSTLPASPLPSPPLSVPTQPPSTSFYGGVTDSGSYTTPQEQPSGFNTPPSSTSVGSDPGYNLAGVWSSNINLTYRIQQSGNNFWWTVDGLSQLGQGTIQGGRVYTTWRGPILGGSSGGTIVTDANGQNRLVMDNGVVCYRQQ